MIKALKTYTLPSNLDDEIQHLQQTIDRFKRGEVSAMEFKVQRVPFGCYEQRKQDTYMVRIRNAGAVVTPSQLEKIAELSKMHAASYIHLTTRQEIQLHYVLIDSLIPVIRGLKEAGLSPRGGGGNTIRNIVAQEDAGIAKDEEFDVSPYAIALTSRMIAEPDSWNLPRKFKYAFSGSVDDRGYATIHDVGFIAKVRDGQRGFKVYLGGGLGAKPQLACVAHEFVPESDVYNVAKAAKNLFYKNGNRKNKHAARLRFVLKNLGEEEFKKKYYPELEGVRQAHYPPLEVEGIENEAQVDPKLSVETVRDPKDFELWRGRFVVEQKQPGLYAAILPAHLGHIDNDAAIALARFMRSFGENTIRIRKDQNLLLRNIPRAYLANLYNFLRQTFENFNRPFIIDKIIACAGASTCQLGICLSPGAATAIKRVLEHVDFDLDAAADARINISGCPNSCGQHHIAHLGFFGKVARQGENVMPAYNVICGAKIKDGETQLAEKVGEIPARDVPSLVRDTLRAYVLKKKTYPHFEEYMRSDEGRADVKGFCDAYKKDPAVELAKDYYFDWGTDKIFSVAERGKGECSAGIFDLIESDLGSIQQAQKVWEDLQTQGGTDAQRAKALRDMVFYSARVLLVTRALEAKSEQETFAFFRQHFIETGLVDASFAELLTAVASGREEALLPKKERVFALAQRMKYLYDVMDPAFNFKISEATTVSTAATPAEHQGAKPVSQAVPAPSNAQQQPPEAAQRTRDILKDFRGVGCPMNFVKTKMELAKLKPMGILEIWIDDGAPIQNVPGSVREEGHRIVEQKKIGNHWSVVIEKR